MACQEERGLREAEAVCSPSAGRFLGRRRPKAEEARPPTIRWASARRWERETPLRDGSWRTFQSGHQARKGTRNPAPGCGHQLGQSALLGSMQGFVSLGEAVDMGPPGAGALYHHDTRIDKRVFDVSGATFVGKDPTDVLGSHGGLQAPTTPASLH